MRIRYRKEDEADKWLKKHDPYYKSTAKNKRKKAKYALLLGVSLYSGI